MNPGKLNHRISIQKYDGKAKTTNGFNEDKWIEWQSVRASKNNLFGREFWAAKAVNSEKTIEFVIRYSKFIEEMDTKDFRIVDKQGTYNIIFIDNVKYQNKFVKIKAECVS